MLCQFTVKYYKSIRDEITFDIFLILGLPIRKMRL